MPTIKQYLLNYDKYKVDYTYQRPEGVWSSEDKQCLIDTILKNEPMPMFFLNDRKDGHIYIVDGQQRLSVIKNFFDGKIKLSKKFSLGELDGAKFNNLADDLRERFFDYYLNFHYFDNYDDEKVRMMFSRLQRGKPLQIGERMNAMPGNIVNIMRDMAEHQFLANAIKVNKERYGAYPDVVRILFFELNGCAQSGSNELYAFMSNNKDLNANDATIRRTKSNLDYLIKCFPDENGYAHLEKHAWVLTVYSLVSDLKDSYVLAGREEEFGNFIKEFHAKIYCEDRRRSEPLYQKFYDNVRGGWSEKIIKLRLEIIKKFILKDLNLAEIDTKRQINNEDKIALFGKHPNCEVCGYRFKDYREPEYHHIKRHADGGQTSLDNIQVLCNACHSKTFSMNLESPDEDEYEESDV